MASPRAKRLFSIAVIAAAVTCPSQAQAAPTQAQLDAWTAEIIRYCTPEIRNYTTLSLIATKQGIATANRNKAPGDVTWIFSERTERANLAPIIQQTAHWTVTGYQFLPEIDDIYRRRSSSSQPKSEAAKAAENARLDVQYCMRTRMIELEFPGYKRW